MRLVRPHGSTVGVELAVVIGEVEGPSDVDEIATNGLLSGGRQS